MDKLIRRKDSSLPKMFANSMHPPGQNKKPSFNYHAKRRFII